MQHPSARMLPLIFFHLDSLSLTFYKLLVSFLCLTLIVSGFVTSSSSRSMLSYSSRPVIVAFRRDVAYTLDPLFAYSLQAVPHKMMRNVLLRLRESHRLRESYNTHLREDFHTTEYRKSGICCRVHTLANTTARSLRRNNRNVHGESMADAAFCAPSDEYHLIICPLQRR